MQSAQGSMLEREAGIFLINFGASTVEMSILSCGGMVLNRLHKAGGSHFHQEIAALIKNRYQSVISGQTAEFLRKEAGLFPNRQEAIYRIPCRKWGQDFQNTEKFPEH